jgi:hypothetical protein
MSKFSKISLTIFIFVLAGLLIYSFLIFRDRNSVPNKDDSQQSAEQEQENAPSTDSSTDSVTDNSSIDSEDADNTEGESESVTSENTDYINISRSDCDNNCQDFTDPDDLKYCQQVCGLTEIKKDVTEKTGCDALQDLEKDYCLKDLAITKKDISLCAKISDTNVLKTCKNRIAQDLLESQN